MTASIIPRNRLVCSWPGFGFRLAGFDGLTSGLLAYLEPGPDACGAMFGDCCLERPSAGVVGDEGDMGGAAGLDEDGVAPIGLPAVVHRMQEPCNVAPKPQRLDKRRLVGEREHGRRAARKEEGWL